MIRLGRLDGEAIEVKQSVWRNHTGEPKREKNKGAIPVIAQLKLFLDRRSGHPRDGFIFRNSLGKPLNLDALARKVIRPALEAEKIPWYGWHAFRRGLAKDLHRLGVSDKAIQQILRHANVTTTINICVKMVTRALRFELFHRFPKLFPNSPSTEQISGQIQRMRGRVKPFRWKQLR